MRPIENSDPDVLRNGGERHGRSVQSFAEVPVAYGRIQILGTDFSHHLARRHVQHSAPHRNGGLPLMEGQQHQHAVLILSRPDPPLLVQGGGVFIGGLEGLQFRHRDDDHLDAGLALQILTDRSDSRLPIRINDRGVIVGYGDGGSAFVWQDGVFSELAALNGSATSFAFDVDSRGCVVGYSATPNGEAHATLWCEGQTIDLGALPGGAFSEATGINKRGQIVGWGYNSAFEPHAILWEDGQVIDLGTLPGGSASFAMDINDRGVIAGFSNAAAGPDGVHATVWTERRRP